MLLRRRRRVGTPRFVVTALGGGDSEIRSHARSFAINESLNTATLNAETALIQRGDMITRANVLSTWNCVSLACCQRISFYNEVRFHILNANLRLPALTRTQGLGYINKTC